MRKILLSIFGAARIGELEDKKVCVLPERFCFVMADDENKNYDLQEKSIIFQETQVNWWFLTTTPW